VLASKHGETWGEPARPNRADDIAATLRGPAA